jgi:micrococcal nuclease
MPLKLFIKNNQIKAILIALIILATSGATYVSSEPKYSKKPVPEINPTEQYEVNKVVDGDTFSIKIDKRIINVRMIGVDTPETVDPRKTVQCFGKEASDKTKELLVNQTVRLEIDKTQGKLDKFGRILAYVYRSDEIFINSYLIENGYAHEYTYNIPYKFQEEFKNLEKIAKEEKRGLWGELCKI